MVDRETWIRPLIGAAVALLVAILTALARAIAKGKSRPPDSRPGSESTDVLIKIVRHSKSGDARRTRDRRVAHRGPRGSPRGRDRRSA
jgi:hypothetical protein